MSLGLSPFRAQAKLDDLPATPEAIKYLMALVNGSNPEIPPYMALGRLEQMKHEMEKEAPQPPQGTVKDKTMQAAGVMALQGGQQQQAAQQMAQAAPQNMPVPQNVPQPQMQPEEETQMAADGGLMRARVDSDMFNFAPGGIVSFAGGGKSEPESAEEKQRKEDQAAVAKLLGLIKDANRGAGAAIADVAALPIRGLAGAYDTAVVRPMRAAGIDAGYLSKHLVPEGVDPSSMTPFYDKYSRGSGAKEKPQLQGPRKLTGAAAAEQDRLAKAREEFNKGPQTVDAPPAPPPPPPADGQRPPAGPRPAGNVGIAQAIPPEAQIVLDRLKKSDTDAQGIIGKLGEQAERFKKDFYEPMKTEAGKTELQLAKERAEIDRQLGIGQYGEELEKARQERAKRYEDTKKGRSDKIIDSMLDAFVTPGARAGDMSKARSALKQKYEDADEEFSTAQQNMMLDVKKYREQLAIGNRDKAFEAKTAANANFVKMATELAKLENVPLEQALSFIQSSNKQYQDVYKAILDFRKHKEEIAARAAERRDAAKMQHQNKQQEIMLRGRALDIQAAAHLSKQYKPDYDKLASAKALQQTMYSTAIKNNELEKADKIAETIMDIEEKQAKLLAPLMAMQGSGITGAPGAAAASQGKLPAGVNVTRAPS